MNPNKISKILQSQCKIPVYFFFSTIALASDEYQRSYLNFHYSLPSKYIYFEFIKNNYIFYEFPGVSKKYTTLSLESEKDKYGGTSVISAGETERFPVTTAAATNPKNTENTAHSHPKLERDL
jgi:hypothetical protein